MLNFFKCIFGYRHELAHDNSGVFEINSMKHVYQCSGTVFFRDKLLLDTRNSFADGTGVVCHTVCPVVKQLVFERLVHRFFFTPQCVRGCVKMLLGLRPMFQPQTQFVLRGVPSKPGLVFPQGVRFAVFRTKNALFDHLGQRRQLHGGGGFVMVRGADGKMVHLAPFGQCVDDAVVLGFVPVRRVDGVYVVPPEPSIGSVDQSTNHNTRRWVIQQGVQVFAKSASGSDGSYLHVLVNIQGNCSPYRFCHQYIRGV